MARRKVNVLSNELDQAPKTREAGYGKVVNSMRKEINEAMDRIFLNGSDVIADYMNHTNKIPIKQLLELKPWDSFTFEIKREKIKPTGWFSAAVWHPAFLWDSSNSLGNYIHNFYWRAGDWYIKPWEISTAIVVKKDTENHDLLHIHAEQLEYPGKWAMLMQWMFFHNPNVSDEKFKEIVWTDYKKEEIKEQIKENINEEIEIEEEEEKEEKKAEQNKWDKSEDVKFKERKVGEPDKKSLWDTIKWWFGKK